MSETRARPASEPGQEALDAFCEYLRRLERGDAGAFEDFCAERPSLATQLERLHAEYVRVSAILERLAPAASFAERLRARYGHAVDPGISLSGEGGAPEQGAQEAAGLWERLEALGGRSSRYERRAEIARGGMGVVLKVWDRELRRMLAMKVVLPRRGAEEDSDAAVGERRLARFLEEAQITGQLDHPGIVPVHDLGIDHKGRVYFTMQLIDGRDLREIFELARAGREGWTRTRVLWAILRVCEAMAYAHSKGVVHRDLKPANIMVGRFGETYVMDWGLAKVMGREDPHDLRLATEREEPRVVTDRSSSSTADADSPLRTLDGDVVGTPAYMAPEQALGRLDEIGPHSDVYSVGAMLYHLLSGHMPFEPLGERVPSTTVLEAVRSGAPWPLAKVDPSLDAELVAICEKAMAREIGRRYANMLEFAEDLRAHLEGRVVRAYETGALYEFRKWVSRNRGVAGSLGALVLVGLVSVAVFIRQQQVSLARLLAANEETERERMATLEAKQLAEQNALDLAHERDRANLARLDAEDKKALAEQNWKMALENAEMTRRQGYRAQILAADYSLRLEEVAVAKASLAATNPDLRDWEWRHLRLSTEGWTRELLRGERGIAHLSSGGNGGTIAALALDFQLRVLDLESGRVVQQIHTAPFGGWTEANPFRMRTAIAPNGLFGLCASHGELILVFDTRTGAVPGALTHPGAKTSLGFSGDGRRIVSASDSGTTIVWDTASLRSIVELSGHEGSVRAALLSSDGERALTGGLDGSVRLWEVEGGRELARLSGDRARAVSALAWSPVLVGEREPIAIAYEDGSIALWDARGAGLYAMLTGHSGTVRSMVFAPDGSLLYSGGDDMTVRVFRAGTGRQERVLRGHDREVTAVALAQGGELLVSSSLDGSVRVWDPSWDPAVASIALAAPTLGVAFDAGGERLLACPTRGGPRAFDSRSLLAERVLEAPPAIAGEPSPELQIAFAASGDGTRIATFGADRRVRLRRSADGEIERVLVGPRRSVRCMALSQDGSLLALGASDGSIWLWDWGASEEPRVLDAHRRDVLALSFAPRGAELASVGRDRSLRLWDAAQGRQVGLWTDAHALAVNAVAFSADGELLLTASSDGRARVWRRDARQPVLTLRGKEGALTAIAMSPDGRRILTGAAAGELGLWDARTGDLLLHLFGHQGLVSGLCFDREGARILSCATDPELGRSELRVWESGPAQARYAARVEGARLAARADRRVDEELARDPSARALLQLAEGGLALEDEQLAAAVRRAAHLRCHDADFLVSFLDRALLLPAAPPEEWERVARLAERAGVLRAGDLEALRLFGAAQVRAGRGDEGLRILRTALRDRARSTPFERARDALFVALGLLRVRELSAARAALAEARAPFEDGAQLGEEERAALRELEPLLGVVQAELDAGAGAGAGG